MQLQPRTLTLTEKLHSAFSLQIYTGNSTTAYSIGAVTNFFEIVLTFAFTNGRSTLPLSNIPGNQKLKQIENSFLDKRLKPVHGSMNGCQSRSASSDSFSIVTPLLSL